MSQSSTGARKCDNCSGPLHVQGHDFLMPRYHCSRCNKDYCNPCASRTGRQTATATVACPLCKADIKTGRTFDDSPRAASSKPSNPSKKPWWKFW